MWISSEKKKKRSRKLGEGKYIDALGKNILS